jgi:hypothetical protein
MEPMSKILIRVQAEWNGWKSAEIRLGDLEDVHWLQPDRASHAFIHGYVHCTQVVSGDLPHNCNPRSEPHRLLVCVLKRHTISTAYAELARRADAQRVTAFSRDAILAPTTGSVQGRRTA